MIPFNRVKYGAEKIFRNCLFHYWIVPPAGSHIFFFNYFTYVIIPLLFS